MRRALARIALAPCLCAAGCSLLFDYQVEQCKFNADCNPISGEALLECVEGLCVSPPRCERNRDCAEQADAGAQICVEARCQRLLDPEAPACFAQLPKPGPLDDDAIVLGAFSPKRDRARVGMTSELMPLFNYELALVELNANGGLPPGNRQVALVVCDNGDRASSEAAQKLKVYEGFYHLSTTLRVPGIITGLTSAQAVRLAVRDHHHKPFVLAPFASDGTTIDDDEGLIWYLMDPRHDGAAIAGLVERLAAGPQLADEAAPRVLVWRSVEAVAQALWTRLEGPLADTHVDVTSVESTSILDQASASSAAILDEIVEARPDIVVALSPGNVLAALAVLDRRWRERWPEVPFPICVLPPHLAGNTKLVQLLRDAPQLDASRFLGASFDRGDADVLTGYLQRFRSHFGGFDGLIYDWNYYDAAYYLVYAAYAANPRGARALSPQELRGGFRRLWEGDPVEVGPAGKARAFDGLARDPSVFLKGTLGVTDFDVTTGTPTSTDLSVFCLERGTGGEVSYRYDVLLYDANSERFEAGFEAGEPAACSALLAQ